MDLLSRLWTSQPDGSRTTLVVSTTVVTTLSLLALFRYALQPSKPQTYPNPLVTTIPKLSKEELDSLLYKPDAFPGARDVQTPYGSIRVYEFGPPAGRKVLFIHGISTSCQSLTYLAHDLARRGCRVMLFDLFGRGFSDGVGDLPHDARLYASQALLAMASSPVAWTGAGALHLVGYSLGGGVAVHLAGALPGLVAGLVLLAPAGLIRPANFGAVTRFLFTGGWVPEGILARMTKSRLQRPIAASAKQRRTDETDEAEQQQQQQPAHQRHHPGAPVSEAVALAASEAADPPPGSAAAPLERRVLGHVGWMAAHHEGFIPSFTSSLRYAPLMGQEAAYAALAGRPAGSTCVVLGRGDEIVHPVDYAADALPLLGGRERVKWEVVEGGHDFPMTNPGETLRVIYEFWGWEAE
ncbi:Alpha beta hydrolase family [Pleurostoma richardsiae]|uniref:Alpha beta hydrolase family n=1 Tax=Pleurostoma richardsiae TaxID=41990 RepID=A0AA38RVZ7_9PEZI|nr:Alpha beta hydrolase family [Pleurostoma richardsiae]